MVTDLNSANAKTDVLVATIRATEAPTKVCVDCQEARPLGFFYTNASAKDGRQSRCRECDKKRRGLLAQGQGMRATANAAKKAADLELESSRKRAVDTEAAKKAERLLAQTRPLGSPLGSPLNNPPAYVGVTGGPLIYGYVLGPPLPGSDLK